MWHSTNEADLDLDILDLDILCSPTFNTTKKNLQQDVQFDTLPKFGAHAFDHKSQHKSTQQAGHRWKHTNAHAQIKKKQAHTYALKRK